MANGVIINMSNVSALITVAMLSTFLKEKNKDYLDILMPFILMSLPNKQKEIVNKEVILDKLKVDYGFDEFPIHVLNTLLNRCCREKYLGKSNNDYYVIKIYNNTEFKQSKTAIKHAIDIVINKLGQYLQANTTIKPIDDESVKKMLISFLEFQGIAVCNDMNCLKKLTNSDMINYNIARFIIKESESETNVFDSILEIVKGFFIYKSVYYFSEDKKLGMSSKLKNTLVFFDTRLLIHALGYNTQEDKRATRELINLIRDSGGNVKAFIHVKDEVASILTKYARDYTSHPTMRLEYLDNQAYSSQDVLRLRDSLEINLRKVGIEIVETPDRDLLSYEIADDAGFIDVEAFESKLEEAFGVGNVDNRKSSRRVENDTRSIEAISLIRKKNRSANIEDCKAIFVTQNNVITKTVKEFFNERFSKGEISFSIHEMDLTALLWLRNFNKNSNMPKFKLLENAYAACMPSDELIEVFLKQVDLLNNEGKITREEALIMRTQRAVHNNLVELTHNDYQKINETTVTTVCNNYIKSITKDRDEKIHQSEKIINSYKEKETIALKHAEIIATEKSKDYERVLNNTAKYSIFILGIISVICMVISFLNGIDSDKYWITIVSCILLFVSLLQLYDYFISKKSLVNRWIGKKKTNRFNDVYKEEVNRIKKIFN